MSPVAARVAVRRMLVLAGLLATAVSGAAARNNAALMREKLLDYVATLRPRAPAGIPRPENISDIEIREIQAAAGSYLPTALINIGTVMVGCPCEDGAKCRSQVWVVGWTPEKTSGLLFSQIGGHWVIGPVQKWWLAYDALLARARSLTAVDFAVAQDKLLQTLPTCEARN